MQCELKVSFLAVLAAHAHVCVSNINLFPPSQVIGEEGKEIKSPNISYLNNFVFFYTEVIMHLYGWIYGC